MAKATVSKKAYELELTLTRAEARTLRMLLARTGGDSAVTARAYADSINIALIEAMETVDYDFDTDGEDYPVVSKTSDAIYFVEASKSHVENA